MSNRRNLVAKQMIPRTSGVNKYILGISPEAVRSSPPPQWKQWIFCFERKRWSPKTRKEWKEWWNLKIFLSTEQSCHRFHDRGEQDLVLSKENYQTIFFPTRIYNCFPKQNEVRTRVELKLIIRFNKRRPIDARVCINSWKNKEYSVGASLSWKPCKSELLQIGGRLNA